MSAKTKNIIRWILCALLTLGLGGAGLSKILGAEMQVNNFVIWGYPDWARYPIGLIELSTAIFVLLTKYRDLALYGVFAFTLGAVFTHIQAGQIEQIPAPIIFSLLALAIKKLK